MAAGGASSLASLSAALLQTLSPVAGLHQQAAAYLQSLERSPGFGTALLLVAESASQELVVRQAAATFFKNYVRRQWADDDSGVISAADRAAIKVALVPLMSTVPPLVQRQLCEALTMVSRHDFPDQWPSLLPELVAQLRSAGDMGVVSGVLGTAASVFERFSGCEDTDENRAPLKVALDAFAAPLTDAFKALDARADEALRAGGVTKAVLAPVLGALKAATRCYFLLNWLDLPEYFEDHIAEWMTAFHKYLAARHAVVSAGAGDTEEGALEALQSEVLAAVDLYASKYEEEFEPFLPTLVGDVWQLLSSMPPEKLLAPALDGLVTRAVRFLSAVVGKPALAASFAAESVLRDIVTRIVVPNVTLRDDDVAVFEENPVDFIRGDIEGSDADTRRRCASDLVRAMAASANARVTPIVLEVIARLLEQYATDADRARGAVAKDAAVALLMAAAVRTSTVAAGVTSVNELVSLGAFLTAHVLPELQAPDVDACPLAKAASIKFVTSFRGLFGADELHALLPVLVRFVAARDYVTHTYAAAAIERVLTVRGAAAGSPAVAGRGEPRVSAAVLAPLLAPLLGALFAKMEAPGYPENEYLMRCVMRVVVSARERCAGVVASILGALTTVLGRVCRNPSNPAFNHYMFESVASLMRSTCAVRPEAVADFEALLFPPFKALLANDVLEFLPYVFQLLAELLDLRPAPLPGASSLSDGFAAMLPPLLTPQLWGRKGNVPPLTDLLAAYLRRGAVVVVSTGSLQPLLGVWQKLTVSKGQEGFGFELFDAMAECLPLATLQQYLPTIIQVMLRRVQEAAAIRVARMFVHSAAVLCGVHGPAPLEAVLGSLPGASVRSIVEAVIVPMANKVAGAARRRNTAVGLTRLLCEAAPASLLGDAAGRAVWGKLLVAVVELLEPPPADTVPASRVVAVSAAGGDGFMEDEPDDAAPSGGSAEVPPEYSAAYSRLVHAALPVRYVFTALPPPQAYLAHSLTRLAASAAPGLIAGLVAESPVAKTVAAYSAAATMTPPLSVAV